MDGPDSILVTIALVVVAGYLIGSIPIANLIARRRATVDLRHIGDRNPGYWNAKEQLGRRAALPVFIGDVAKGAAAAGLGLLLADESQWWLAHLGAGAAMVGHAFPVFAGFRGGRSVLAFVGGALVFAPLSAAVAIGILLIVLAATRRFDVSARVGVAVFPVAQILIEGPYRTAATGALMTFIGLRFAQAAISERRERTDRPSAASGPPPNPGSPDTPGPATSGDA